MFDNLHWKDQYKILLQAHLTRPEYEVFTAQANEYYLLVRCNGKPSIPVAPEAQAVMDKIKTAQEFAEAVSHMTDPANDIWNITLV